MDKKHLPVGVFDSGIGGLTVVREIFRNLPDESIVYFGDTARVPYGNKSKETIIRYSKQIAEFLVSQDVKAIVIACNTASALALDALRDCVPVPVIGVVEPGARAALRMTRNKRIGVIGTVGTVRSGLYAKYICEQDPEVTVLAQACPLFVHLVEEGMIDDPVTIEMIHRYLSGMVMDGDIDTLVMACTHYPLLRKVIRREIDLMNTTGSLDEIQLVNPAYETTLALKELLDEKGLINDGACGKPEHRYFVSDDIESFRHFAYDITGIEIDHAESRIFD